MWTCIVCGFKYDESSGDTEERMCFKCLNEYYAEDEE